MSTWNWTELILVLLLIGVVALMAASETAITKTGRARAYRLVEEKRRGARSLQRIIDDLPPYLGVVSSPRSSVRRSLRRSRSVCSATTAR